MNVLRSAEDAPEIDLSWLKEAEELAMRRRNRNKNGRRRKKNKKKTHNNEDGDDDRPSSGGQQQQPHRQFNDLWIPLAKIR